MTAAVLELEGISKHFGAIQALTDVSLALRAGEVVGLMGDNGAGKSTLVKAIAGINPPDSGTVRFEGKEVSITTPQAGRVLRFGDRDLVAGETDRARVRAVDARDRLHHRRLAGAVVADQADDLALVDGEVDPVQSLDRAESLAYSVQLEERSAGLHLSR